MKKHIILFVAVMVSSLMFCTGQTYTTIYLDSATNKQHVPYNKNGCDFIKVIAPKGAILVTWDTDKEVFQIEDGNIVVNSGYNGAIYCKYNDKSEKKYITVHALIAPPNEVNFKDTTYIVDGKPILVDAKNYSKYDFTKYIWSNGATEQIVYLMEGTYTVTVSNVCGTWTKTFVIIDKTPARYK